MTFEVKIIFKGLGSSPLNEEFRSLFRLKAMQLGGHDKQELPIINPKQHVSQTYEFPKKLQARDFMSWAMEKEKILAIDFYVVEELKDVIQNNSESVRAN